MFHLHMIIAYFNALRHITNVRNVQAYNAIHIFQHVQAWPSLHLRRFVQDSLRSEYTVEPLRNKPPFCCGPQQSLAHDY